MREQITNLRRVDVFGARSVQLNPRVRRAGTRTGAKPPEKITDPVIFASVHYNCRA